jgi:transcriptional regulator with GAF, ATPase, and Fis domain
LIVDRDEDGAVTTPTRPQEKVAGQRESSATAPVSLADKLDSFERTVIARALAEAGGNVADAARRLQTDRPNLYRRMKRLGLNPTRV